MVLLGRLHRLIILEDKHRPEIAQSYLQSHLTGNAKEKENENEKERETGRGNQLMLRVGVEVSLQSRLTVPDRRVEIAVQMVAQTLTGMLVPETVKLVLVGVVKRQTGWVWDIYWIRNGLD